MENYFNYFTEIEEYFQVRRGSLILLSPLDWALIESFQQAGIPLQTVLRGIDLAFEKYTKRSSRVQRVNSLSYCSQTILTEFQRLQESSVGKNDGKAEEGLREGKERENLAEMISRAAEQLRQVPTKVRYQELASSLQLFERAAESLRSIEEEVRNVGSLNYEQLELRLSTIEERILAALVTASSEEALLTLRTEVNHELPTHFSLACKITMKRSVWQRG